MTIINCKLNDSGGSPLTGFVRVIADYIITNDVTGTATLPVPKDTQLVNGQCDLDLQDSATARVSYRIEVWQVTGTTTGLVWTFNAKVPSSITPIPITDLIATGITKDALDTGLLSVTRRILSDETFWSRLRSDTLNFKGEYGGSILYRRGDAVVRDGSSYLSIFDGIHQGKDPLVSPSYWLLIAAKGEVAVNLTGDNTPYSAAGWANKTSSPTMNTLRNVIETLAPKNAPALTYPYTTEDLTPGNYGAQIPNSKWVKDRIGEERALTISTVDSRVNASKPRIFTATDLSWGNATSISAGQAKDVAKQTISWTGLASLMDISVTISLFQDTGATRRALYYIRTLGSDSTTQFTHDLLPGRYETLSFRVQYTNINLPATPFLLFMVIRPDVTIPITIGGVSIVTTIYPA